MATSRREILKTAAAAAVLGQIGSIQRAAASDRPAAAGDLASHYSLDPSVTYLNHASIGTVPAAVQQAHRRYLDLCETNPWLYMWSEPWREPLDGVRMRAANLLGCASDELAIVHNTTELFNTLAQGLPLGAGDEVLFSSLNHSGASVCWENQSQARGFGVRRFDWPVGDVSGMTDDDVVALYERQLRPETRALVLPHVDNMIGLRHPVARIAASARENGVRWVLVDGAQSVNVFPVDVVALGVDVYATSAHKWTQSPKGLGFAYVRRELVDDVRPMWVTWGQKLWHGEARKLEDYGTRALPAVLALGDALDFQAATPMEEREACHSAHRRTVRELVETSPRLEWRSPSSWELGAALYAVEVKGRNSSDVASAMFRDHGVVVRPFSTPELNALRVSPNLANTSSDLERWARLAGS